MAPRVFRAPEAPAAREARRPHFVRRRASKPARALRTLRRPPHQWGQLLICGSARRLVVRPGPTATAARPSGPSGALHTCGAWCAVGCLGTSARSPARPRHRPRAPQPVPPAPSTPVGPGRCVWYPVVCRVGSLSVSRPQPLISPIPEPHPISHVIPPRPFQTMNPQRWNCNVFRLD